MALIVYPDPNADSFVTVQQADLYISTLTLNGNDWNALDTETKEVYLRIAYRNIIDNTDPTTYPDPLPVCVGEAQSLMAVHDLVNGLSEGTVTAEKGAIRSQKVGSIEQSFYDVKGYIENGTVSRLPEAAKPCLFDLGYDFSTIKGIKQTILGRS